VARAERCSSPMKLHERHASLERLYSAALNLAQRLDVLAVPSRVVAEQRWSSGPEHLNLVPPWLKMILAEFPLGAGI
jgi:hypothetical protein